jgi:arylsulfatase A-like enzyme
MKPNIVFILADDYGWRDTACYGSSFYETPTLDKLAREGMKFTNAYATCPVCSPSRASLLTGKYPARIGITNYIDWGGKSHPSHGILWDAPYRKGLPDGETSVADALREADYQTWHVGKWHLGETGHLPQDHGFDVNIGGCHIGHPHKGYFAPWHIPEMPPEEIPDGTYLTDYLTDCALRLLQTRDPSRPFFLNLWHYAVHTPIQAPEPLVEKYREKARGMRLDQVNPIVEGEPFPCHHKRNSRVQRRVIQSDPAYAAIVENMDANIGRILQALEDLGLADDTLVVYTSDNGGLSSAEGSPTCNHPLAEGKGWMFDGGIREPLIARWPGRIAPGTTSDAVTTGTDLYPTFLEAAELPLRPEQHVDGKSILPVLQGKAKAFSRGPVFWHFPHYGNQGGTPAAAVRDGDWKLLRFFEDDRRELYNLETDIGEAFECSAGHPEIAARLASELDAWISDVGGILPERHA